MPPLDHNRDASRRERTVEHLFVGELLRHAWRTGLRVEVLRPEVDADGYDLVLECGGVIRHVQLKASRASASTSRVPVHLSLADRPSGCVVWVLCGDDDLAPVAYLFLGGAPGEPLSGIEDLPAVRHSRANAEGVKGERPSLRSVAKGRFAKVESVEELCGLLLA
ncbi:MAG: hypothetical protein AAGH92_13010 [Planctomycetota bacterium]